MGNFTETIKVVIETSTGQAAQGLRNFSSSVKEADGLTGKFKAGMSSLGGTLDQVGSTLGIGLGGGIAAAGAAAVAFGVKAVGAFQDVALESGRLADATGLTTEEASRWVEVAGDIGISSQDLTTSFGRLAKSIGENPAHFQDLGVKMAYAKDGTLDMNGTILNAIDLLNHTPDASKRAALGAELFGRSWQNIAELINEGADEIKGNLADVSEAKVINRDELEQARKFRAAMDNLSDAVEDVTIIFGEFVEQAIEPTVDGITTIVGGLDKVANVMGSNGGGLISTINRNINPWAKLSDVVNKGKIAFDGSYSAIDRVKAGLTASLPLDSLPIVGGFFHVETAAEKAEKAARKFEQSQEDVAKASEASRDAGDSSLRAYDTLGAAYTEAATAADVAASASENLAAQQEAAAKSAEDAIKAEKTLRDSRNASLDAGLAAIDAERKMQESLAKTKAVVEDASASFDDQRDSVYDTGKTVLDYADAQAKAEHTTLNATQRNAILARSWVDAAGDNKALQGEVRNWIARLNEIPPNKKTDILSALDRGDYEEAKRLLNSLSGSATIHVGADLSSFWGDYNAAKAKVSGTYIKAPVTGGRTGFAQGGVVRFAQGGTVDGGVVMTGERGPEPVGLPDGSQVMPAERLAMIVRDEVRRIATGPTINVGRRMSQRQIEDETIRALRRWNSRNGSILLGRTI